MRLGGFDNWGVWEYNLGRISFESGVVTWEK